MRKKATLIVVFQRASLIILTACNGGGGSSVSALGAMAPAASPAMPASGGSISFQPGSAAVTYQAASATALVTNSGLGGTAIAPSGGGATVTITTDGTGLTKIALSVPTTGATFNQQYDFSVWDYGGPLSGDAPTKANLVTILREVFGFANTTGSAITQSTGAQTLNWAAYGFWASGDTAATGRAGTLAFGELTKPASVPSTGSATFNGTTIGIGGPANGSTMYALQGNARIVADFATHAVTSNFTNLSTQNISTNAIGLLPDLSGTSSISGGAYTGTLAGMGLSGTLNGNFYGSSAQETAGVWQASGGGNSWIGSYGAK